MTLKNTKIESETSDKSSLVKASLKGLMISDKKVRIIVNVIRGRKVENALSLLLIQQRSSAAPIYKLLQSAKANAIYKKLDTDKLIIKKIYVDKGKVYKRVFPRSQGRVNYIKRRSSHITIHLAEINITN